jgi:outer membrane lipoprotein-sorting protein
VAVFLTFLAAAAVAAESPGDGGGPPGAEGKEPPREGEEEAAPDDAPDIDALIEQFENMYRSTSSFSRMEMTVVNPRLREPRRFRMKAWTRGEEKALIVIESPARYRGRATLKVEDNLWNYSPKISRTIRIPPSMMLGSWMGSDFTNDDLVRESSFRKDYGHELVGRSADPEGWLVRLTAKPGVVGLWSRMDVVFSGEGTIPLKAEYYDRKDRLARTIVWDEVRGFGERTLPARMVLTPHDEKKRGHRTEMRYLDIDFDVDVPESTFSLARLERSR